MTVTVVNQYNKPDPDSIDFICDRSSPVGNPFLINGNNDRKTVCAMYEDYFHRNLNPDWSPPGFLEYLDKIIQAAKEKDITLGCWCAPRRCHCDTIKEYVEAQVSRADPPV